MFARSLVLPLALLLGAPLAAAQQPGPPAPQSMAMCSMMLVGMHGMMPGMPGGQMQGMQGMQGGGMQGMAMSDSTMMSHLRSELGLSDAQAKQMEDAHRQACAAAQPHLTMAMQEHRAAMQAIQGDSPDLAAYRSRLQAEAGHMVEAQVAMTKAMLDFHRTLTPEQRRKLGEMHEQMMRGGMGADTAGHGAHHPGGAR